MSYDELGSVRRCGSCRENKAVHFDTVEHESSWGIPSGRTLKYQCHGCTATFEIESGYRVLRAVALGSTFGLGGVLLLVGQASKGELLAWPSLFALLASMTLLSPILAIVSHVRNPVSRMGGP